MSFQFEMLESSFAAPGRYRHDVAELANKFPSLRYNDYKKFEPERRFASQSRIACCEFDDAIPEKVRWSPIDNAKELGMFLEASHPPSPEQPRRRLFVLEGLDPECVSLLGIALEINPVIFTRHQRTALWESQHQFVGDALSLPTLHDSRKGFMLGYCELRHIDLPQNSFFMRCAENERYIHGTRLDGHFAEVGMVQRKATFWSHELGEGSWDSLLIIDEPLKHVLEGDRHNHRRVPVNATPFQGGYPDFIKYANRREALLTPGPPRSSLFDDLRYYLTHHASALTITANPISCTTFLQKIVASEYLLLANFMQGVLSHTSRLLTRRATFADLGVRWVEERWSDLISAQRRCQAHSHRLDQILMTLGISRPSADWRDVSRDFIHLRGLFEELNRKAETLVSDFTGLAGIVGNRHSLGEARSVRVVTILGMTFLPLSFVSSLFSMEPRYLPGGCYFWVYFAVSVPLMMFIFLVPLLVGLGYETQGVRQSCAVWAHTFGQRCGELLAWTSPETVSPDGMSFYKRSFWRCVGLGRVEGSRKDVEIATV